MTLATLSALPAFFNRQAGPQRAGLHRRAGPDTLEIGYWIGARFLRRGLATRVASMLTDAVFSLPEISVWRLKRSEWRLENRALKNQAPPG